MTNGKTILKMKFRTRLRIFLAIGCSAIAALLFSCRASEEKRSFSEVQGFDTPVQNKEIVVPADHGKTESPHGPGDGHDHGDAQAAAGQLKWQLPKGWEAHVGSGMYYAIVKTSAKPDAGEIGIISLPGEAGGLKANAERWLGQIGAPAPAGGMDGFLAGLKPMRTKGNLDLTVIDYCPLVKEEDGTSMLVAIAKPGNDSYFIKWTGKKGDLVREKKNFLSFVGSLGFE